VKIRGLVTNRRPLENNIKEKKERKRKKNYASSKKLLTSIKEKGPLGKKCLFTRRQHEVLCKRLKVETNILHTILLGLGSSIYTSHALYHLASHPQAEQAGKAKEKNKAAQDSEFSFNAGMRARGLVGQGVLEHTESNRVLAPLVYTLRASVNVGCDGLKLQLTVGCWLDD